MQTMSTSVFEFHKEGGKIDILRDPPPNGNDASFMSLVWDSHRSGTKLDLVNIQGHAMLWCGLTHLRGSGKISGSRCRL